MKNLIILFFLAFEIEVNAQEPFLVKDINPQSAWSSPRKLTDVNGTLFFEAFNGLGGELWKSDGTANGTVMVKDIFPGPSNSDINNMKNINGTLYFRANDGVHGVELWKSDGTSAGTMMVKDIKPGSASGYGDEIVYFKNKIFFFAVDNVNGVGLWTTDGTDSGTVLFKDMVTGSMTGGGYNVTIVNDVMYFWGNSNGTTSVELWRSDGTVGGTSMVKTFQGIVSYMLPSNGKLFFAYGGGPTGKQGFWVSDGTDTGTILLKEMDVTHMVYFSGTACMIDMDGVLYFNGNDRIVGNELWKSDGTINGTVLVKNIKKGNLSSLTQTPNFTKYKGLLYFVATDSVQSSELWRSDGTAEGTFAVEAPFSGHTHPTSLLVYKNTLIFNASPWTGNTGTELWRSDGTAAGTSMIYDINPGSGSSSTIWHTESNGKLFFNATHTTYGIELWALEFPNVDIVDVNYSESDEMQIYPNPAKDVVYISGLKEGALTDVRDVNGKLVLRIPCCQFNGVLDLTELVNGVYMIHVYNEGKISNYKLVVNR